MILKLCQIFPDAYNPGSAIGIAFLFKHLCFISFPLSSFSIDSSSGSSSDTSDPLTMTGSGPTITIPLLFLYQTEGMELLQNVMNYAPTLVEVVLTTTPTNISKAIRTYPECDPS